MVLKPGSQTQLSAVALAALAEKAGVPKSVFNVIAGDSGGSARFCACTRPCALSPHRLDGGRQDPLRSGLHRPEEARPRAGAFRGVRGPHIDAAIEGAIVSKYRNMDQTCVCANRLYAQASIYEEFVQKLSTKVAA